MRISLIVLIIFVALTSCSRYECNDYYKLLNDDYRKNKSIEWVDRKIFSREFSEEDFVIGRAVGPGSILSNLSTSIDGLEIPEWFYGYEIRVLNKKKFHPEGVFIGKNSYQGIVITRNKMEEYKNGDVLRIGKLKIKEDRVGMVCLTHFD